jgi:putative Mg2+ transporter-C (MgtC) family protein
MMDFSQMFLHLAVALIIGALMGLERELAGKEAGIRTGMMVAGGAALFSIIALNMPAIVADMTGADIRSIAGSNSGFLGIIANIVVGVGFLGAGIVIKTEEHVHGLTTAAVVWTMAAIGTLAGVGLLAFSIVAGLLVSFSLFCLRTFGPAEISKKNGKH